MTDQIHPSLISALNTLGLTTYEAKVYAALVLYDQAGARDLIEYLQISKPSIYESLQKLQDLGLILKIYSRPAVFAPVHPETALRTLLETHTRAVAVAGKELERLRTEKISEDLDEAVWSVYGNAMVEHKIRDLITRADQRIECLMGERYLPFFLQTKITSPAISLTVISDNPVLEQEIKEKFIEKDATIRILAIPGPEYLPHPPHSNPDIDEYIDISNVLDLVVDDKEAFSIPPIRAKKLSGLHSGNKVVIMMTRDRISGLNRHLERCSISSSQK
jgi:HTH-type transcriptional regulator, sugar sensing transcriptional regulator